MNDEMANLKIVGKKKKLSYPTLSVICYIVDIFNLNSGRRRASNTFVFFPTINIT